MCKKERTLGIQEPIHQILDYVAVEGLMEMLKSKIGVFQCASLPNKGQSYGKKYIEKWVRNKESVYFIKGDIKKCFPSINIDIMKELLMRDVKNDNLLWLVYMLLDMFKRGLSIGSYLSQYLCNYFLSYAYHYIQEDLFKIRSTKRDGKIRVRLIKHALFYMDDFLIIGSSKKDLKMAMKRIIVYLNNKLGLTVKPDWKICKLSETEPIDMMGFVFRQNRTTIRARIFLKARRHILKAKKLIKHNKPIPTKLAYQCVSAFGWFKNTDSRMIRKKLDIDFVVSKCRKTISKYNKNKK